MAEDAARSAPHGAAADRSLLASGARTAGRDRRLRALRREDSCTTGGTLRLLWAGYRGYSGDPAHRLRRLKEERTDISSGAAIMNPPPPLAAALSGEPRTRLQSVR